MRKNILFLILAFGLFFQSCLESVVLEQASDSSSTVGGITIQLTVPSGVNSSVLTKAGTEPGNAAENTINALYIWLYAKQDDNWKATTETPYEVVEPDFNNNEYSIPITTTGVTDAFLASAVDPLTSDEFWAVVYANSATVPTAIASEADFWSDDNDTEVLNPLFFSGSAKFTSDQDGGYIAEVDLKRQVAKLQVKVGVDDDVFPTGLYIDLESVKVEVSGMVDNSAIVLDADGPTDSRVFTIGDISDREATYNGYVTYHNVLRYEVNASSELKSSTVVDYLYMHPKTVDTDESEAIKVQLTMDVKDPTAGTTTTVTTDAIPITTTGSSGVSYSTSNNTIYTLEVTVKSVDAGDGNVTYDQSITIGGWDDSDGSSDWTDQDVDVNVGWGEGNLKFN